MTNTCFVPELNLGITILTNNDNQGTLTYTAIIQDLSSLSPRGDDAAAADALGRSERPEGRGE